uniref:Roadblock/LAMTOR2 domain-containing protein n=1 Tax=Esox lucius TaxID=8010 RepID=A0AAY5L9S2_ESOLU
MATSYQNASYFRFCVATERNPNEEGNLDPPTTTTLTASASTGKYGIPIRTTLDNSTTVQYAGLLHQLTMKARSTVRDIDPQNDLTFLRIRSKKHEIMVAPDKEYMLIVIQNPSE